MVSSLFLHCVCVFFMLRFGCVGDSNFVVVLRAILWSRNMRQPLAGILRQRWREHGGDGWGQRGQEAKVEWPNISI